MVRYKPSQFTKKELEIMVGVLATDAGLDFLTGGKLNKYKRKAAIAIYRSIVKPAARLGGTSLGRLAVTGARVVKQVALKHPVLTAGAVVYYTYKHKDELADLVEQGYEITKPITQPVSQFLQEEVFTPQAAEIARARGTIGPAPVPAFLEQFRPKPRKSSLFNKAVKAGMKAVKGSTSYGKKGVINSPKRAFALVTKLASAKKKKKKAPKKGIRRLIWNAMKGQL
jgi:hypothetical protein